LTQELNTTASLSRGLRLSWLPLIALVSLMIVLGSRTAQESYESATVLLALNFLFTTVVSIFIAVLAGRGFLSGGHPALLMLSCGMTIWGASALAAAIGNRSSNQTATLHNLGIAVSAGFHLAGAILAYRSSKLPRLSAGLLALGSAAAFISVGILWLGTLEGWWPLFFVDGHGGTLVRRLVLICAIIMLGLTSVLTGLLYRRTGSTFLHWYAACLALVAAGVTGLLVQTSLGTLVSWTARAAQYLGGVYMCIGAILAAREARAWELPLHFELERIRKENKRAAKSLAERARLLDLTNDAVLVRDLNDRILYWNRGAEQMYGWASQDAIGTVTHELLTTVHPGPVAEILKITHHEGRWAGELTHTTRDGRHIVVASRWALDHDEHGKPVSVLEINTDITEHRRLLDDLKNADRRKDVFLATLAHELRNPLAPLRNGLQMMKLAGTDHAEAEKARAMMERQLAQMVRLVDDLLDVSRITRDRLELKPERMELASAVRHAQESVLSLCEAAGHALNVSLPTSQIILQADPVRIAQIIGNLLTNACKYTGKNDVITLNVEREGSDAVLSVQDNGIGIPGPMLERIFELFTQVDQTGERAQGGLGIGLSLVKRLVEMHGGSVSAHSEGEGKGSRFVVRLPILIEAPARHEPATETRNHPSAASRRVLVVDDNRDRAESLSLLLRMEGHQTQTAHDGEEAVAKALSYQPDIILLDIGLPKLNGYEACHAIRGQMHENRPLIIALTGWGQAEDRRKTHDAGFDAHLVKPVEYETLAKILNGTEAPGSPTG